MGYTPLVCLEESTFEQAFEKYLDTWRLPSVQKAWNHKKPTLELFRKRYGKSWEATQSRIRLQGSQAIRDERIGHVQTILEGVSETVKGIGAPKFLELSEVNSPAQSSIDHDLAKREPHPAERFIGL